MNLINSITILLWFLVSYQIKILCSLKEKATFIRWFTGANCFKPWEKGNVDFLIFLSLTKSNFNSLPTNIGRKFSYNVSGFGGLPCCLGHTQDCVSGFGGCCFHFALQRSLRAEKWWQFCNGSSSLWQAQLLKNHLVHRAHRVLLLLQLAISGNRLPQIPQRCKFHGVSIGFQLQPSLP